MAKGKSGGAALSIDGGRDESITATGVSSVDQKGRVTQTKTVIARPAPSVNTLNISFFPSPTTTDPVAVNEVVATPERSAKVAPTLSPAIVKEEVLAEPQPRTLWQRFVEKVQSQIVKAQLTVTGIATSTLPVAASVEFGPPALGFKAIQVYSGVCAVLAFLDFKRNRAPQS